MKQIFPSSITGKGASGPATGIVTSLPFLPWRNVSTPLTMRERAKPSRSPCRWPVQSAAKMTIATSKGATAKTAEMSASVQTSLRAGKAGNGRASQVQAADSAVEIIRPP